MTGFDTTDTTGSHPPTQVHETLGDVAAKVAPSLEEMRNEQLKSRGIIGKIAELYRERTSGGSLEAVSKTLEEDERLKESGLDLEKIPEVIRPLYIKIVNRLKSPQTRFKDKRDGLEQFASELGSIEDDLHNELYGKNYRGSGSKVGGLHAEGMALVDRRLQLSTGLITLESEISQVFQRKSSANKTLSDTLKEGYAKMDPKEIRQLQEDLIGYTYDLNNFQGVQNRLASELESTGRQMQDFKSNRKALQSLYTYVLEERTKVEGLVSGASFKSKEWDYASQITAVIGALQGRVDQVIQMETDFHDAMNKKLEGSVKLTQIRTQIPERELEASPLESLEPGYEKRNEEAYKMAQEILKDPFKGYFD